MRIRRTVDLDDDEDDEFFEEEDFDDAPVR